MAAPENSSASGRIAFAYPDFLRYQIARLFVVIGLEMQSVAVGWQVYELTKRPLALGLVGLAQFLPGVILFLVSGHAADPVDRRNLLIYCFGGFAACFTAAVAVVLMLPMQRRPAAPAREPVSSKTILAGLRYIFQHKVVLGSVSLDLFAVLFGGAVALLPVYAREILHTGPWGLGLLRSAPGIGAAVMAGLGGPPPVRGRGGRTKFFLVGGFGVVTTAFVISPRLGV